MAMVSMIPFGGFSQVTGDIALQYGDENLFPGIPSLETMILASWSNSGAYAYYQNEIEIKKIEMQMSKKDWTDYIYVNGNAGYGYYDQVFRDQSIPDLSLNTIISGQQFTYFAGLSLKIPFSSIFQRKQTKKIDQYEISKAMNEADKVRIQVANMVSEKYFELIGIYQAFVSKTNEFEATEIDIRKSEQEFIEGKIDVSGMTEIRKSFLKVQLEKDQANAELIKKITQLELITGLNFETQFYLTWN